MFYSLLGWLIGSGVRKQMVKGKYHVTHYRRRNNTEPARAEANCALTLRIYVAVIRRFRFILYFLFQQDLLQNKDSRRKTDPSKLLKLYNQKSCFSYKINLAHHQK